MMMIWYRNPPPTVCHVYGAAECVGGCDDECSDQGAQGVQPAVDCFLTVCKAPPTHHPVQVDDNQDVLHYCSRAAVTDELESTLPPFMVTVMMYIILSTTYVYMTPACTTQTFLCTPPQERVLGCWNPAFVHVLKVLVLYVRRCNTHAR